MRKMIALLILIIFMLTIGCQAEQKGEVKKEEVVEETPQTTETIEITSTAFKNGEKIPEIYACDFENISPPLNWGAGPEGTKSYVLICDDPDAPSGTFVHWVVYNIPAEVTSLPENIPDSETLDNGATHGSTHFGSLGYGGPCPPSGNPHRYYFKIYAVDFITAWKPGMSETKVMNRIEGHILLQGELMGTYQR